MAKSALAALALAASAAALTLDSFVVVKSGAEGPAMALALRDVESNLYTVTGVAPIFLTGPPAANSLPPGTTVIYVGTNEAAPWMSSFTLPAACSAGWEAHCVVALQAGAPGTNGYASIVASGVGTRGAIFAAYTFTDVVLGFKPYYLFTDTTPAYVGGANVVVNDSLSVVFNPPRYTYRAFFVNDEDLTALHRPDPLGVNVIDLAAWDAFFQTALRTKANAILVGTNPFPDNTATATATRRGLVLSFHHYDLLGSNVFSWPLPAADWDWSLNAGTMSYLWRASIAAQADYPEVVWSIGMRGLNDEPYPSCYPGNDAACAAEINEAMGNQTLWLESQPAQVNATRILYMWQELLGLLSGGLLNLPKGTKVVFTDAGSGYVRLDGNWSIYSEGVYYHTAMMNGGSNQLGEMVPVSRIAQQLMNVVDGSKDTTVFVNNLSDLKPCPMTTAAAFELAWDPAPWNATQDWNATARAHYAKFGQDYAGLSAGDAATYALVWEAFFNVPYIFGGSADQLLVVNVVKAAGEVASAWASGNGVSGGTAQQVAGLYNQLGGDATLATLKQLNTTAWGLLASVPAAKRGFYVSHLLTQVTMHAGCVQALSSLLSACAALAPASPGGPAPNPAAGLADVNVALAALDALLATRRVTEGDSGSWAGVDAATSVVNIPAAWPLRAYYLSDMLSDMNAARGALRTVQISLLSPLKSALLPVRPSAWYNFEAYQSAPAVRAAYPYVSFNPRWNLPTYARINCRTSDVPAKTCFNAPDGGAFVTGSDARVTLQIMTSETGDAPHPASRAAMAELRKLGLAGPPAADAAATVVLRYTTDGSVPTVNSPTYTPGSPPRLTDLVPTGQSQVTITGMGWIDGVATGQTTTTVWVARSS